ncbi:LysR family transcriptional regulator [Oceanomicrobium pacificus]|uniref:LysR family transcriptional regulator n=1 Tax=Oceanomicrobium pacificus TaxID=2692916 RepID=A0A6B0TSV7_9RHOB|nr:LysR family transcriptional regulator [Oceanomicrobium pacificus]MXU64302.1 LysR family transcriptional regulator [Oceanomicrobium pacificus]
MAYLDNIRTFVRVYELGSMSAAARDQRISAAVASARIAQLEDHLSVRLFQRTTRMLSPTEAGQIFYRGACGILDRVAEAEAEISAVTQAPSGTLHVAAPLGLGRRLVAPLIPAFKAAYPRVSVRLRLSDRKLDPAAEGLDLVLFLGTPEDSSLRMRKIADCPRLLCAAPRYLAANGTPRSPDDLAGGDHVCLTLRYPGAPEGQWPLQEGGQVRQVPVSGPFESDDGDVLTQWALDGHGIILKPVFEVAHHLDSGALVPVLPDTPPVPIQLACLFSHHRQQDPKSRLFIDHVVAHIGAELARTAPRPAA